MSENLSGLARKDAVMILYYHLQPVCQEVFSFLCVLLSTLPSWKTCQHRFPSIPDTSYHSAHARPCPFPGRASSVHRHPSCHQSTAQCNTGTTGETSRLPKNHSRPSAAVAIDIRLSTDSRQLAGAATVIRRPMAARLCTMHCALCTHLYSSMPNQEKMICKMRLMKSPNALMFLVSSGVRCLSSTLT